MITHDNQTTSVQFGKDGKGVVGVCGYAGGKLTIQQLIADAEIGKSYDRTKDVSELPKVVLNFTDTKSIDALIACLEFTKKKMIDPYPSWVYAA